MAEERSALEKRLLHTNNGRQKSREPQACPYFGLPEDPQTRLLMPGEAGFCHKAASPDAVRFSHQRTHCLSANHINCPVFARERIGGLPRDIQRNTQSSRGMGWQGWIVVILILALGGIVAGMMLWDGSTVTENEGAGGLNEDVAAVLTATMTITSTPIPTTTPTPTPSATATSLPPTATPQATIPPTFTPVPTDPPVPLMTPTPELLTAQLNEPFVNARIGPDGSFPAVQLLQQTDNLAFEVIGQSDDGLWWQVCCVTGQPVWLSVDTVDVAGDQTAVPVINSPPPTILVNVETLNARALPDTEADIVAELVSGTQLTVTGQYFGWFEVCCVDESVSAWVFADSVTLQGRVQDIPEIAEP